MDRVSLESRSLASSLLTYLTGRGWNVSSVEQGFIRDIPLTVPAVGFTFINSREQERQMGRDNKAFRRPIQVDVYMESKKRADGILDAIADFMDDVTISVTDPMNSEAVVAYMTCFDTESIVLDTLAPVFTAPEITWWRGVAKCVYDVDYLS